MADDWQLEAVHEQFDVFKSLTKSSCNIDLYDLRKLIVETDAIVKKHLRASSISTVKLRKISAEIIKAHHEDDLIKLSYIVVVTNQVHNNKLSKFPVFCITINGQNQYVDMNCSVYLSWNAFLSNNDLPACQFCFPVNGRYNVGKKLMIEFASSPAASRRTQLWRCLTIVAVSGLFVASTFFFKIPPTWFKWVKQLLPIADQFLPDISFIGSQVIKLNNLIQNYKDGSVKMIELTLSVSTILMYVFNHFKDNVAMAWKEVERHLFSLYVYLKVKLRNFFGSASSEAQHDLLAIASRVDADLSKVEEEAEVQLRKVNGKHQDPSEKVSFKLQGLSTTCEDEKCVTQLEEMTSSRNISYCQTIFDNCRNESSFQRQIMAKIETTKSSESLEVNEFTKDLITLTQDKMNSQNSFNDFKDMFESYSCIIAEEFKNRINIYTKMVEAARAAAGHEIDLNAFNAKLNIKGDPKEHYKKEAMQATVEYRLMHRLREKVCEIEKMRNKIVLIPLYKNSEDDNAGFYKCIGIRGAGKFSVQTMVCALKENMVSLDNDSLAVNETSSQMFIRCNEISVFVYQEVNSDTHTSEGVVFINTNNY